MPAERAIAVFARPPLAGRAKTRLIPAIGAAGAAHLQAQLIELALARAAAVPHARVTLWSADDGAADWMQRTAKSVGAALRTQHGADLGERMAHAFATGLAAGGRMLLIGTDCPAQRSDDLRAAFDALEAADAVVQPAEDGGYVLIGLRRPCAALFRDVAWGTDAVLETTRARAREAGVALAELAACWDVDRPADLARAVDLGLVAWPPVGA